MNNLTTHDLIVLRAVNMPLFGELMHQREKADEIRTRLDPKTFAALEAEAKAATRRKYPWLYRKQVQR
jgi:hypothetical protein